MNSLREQIAEALAIWYGQSALVCEHTQLIEHGPAAVAVMSVVQPELAAKDTEIERLREALARTDAMREENLAIATTAIHRAEQAEAERDRLKAAIGRVRTLHSPDKYGDCPACGLDSYENSTDWESCLTISALDQPEDTP